MKNKRRNKYLLLLILLLGISVGYALLSTTLKINGSSIIAKNTWSVYWDNPVVTDGSVTTTAPELSAEENQTLNTIATWTTTLSLPGDFYEFTIDAVNAGTIDAMITDIEDTVTPTLPNYINYEVTYEDGTAIAENHLLAKKNGNTPTVEKYKVRVEFLNTITPEQMEAIPENGVTYTFNYHVTYSQANSSAVNPHRVSYTVVSGDIDTPGSEVCLGEECFYVVGNEGANKVKLFAKYPIKTAEKYVNDEDFNRQYNSYTSEDGMKFSNEAYWFDNDEYQIKPKYSQVDIFETYGETHYVYDENSLLYPHVSNYAQILSNQGFDVTARLISLKELTDFYAPCDISYDNFSCSGPNGNNDVSNNIAIWLGNEEEVTYIWMYSSGGGAGTNYDLWWDNGLAVRPLVIIDK